MKKALSVLLSLTLALSSLCVAASASDDGLEFYYYERNASGMTRLVDENGNTVVPENFPVRSSLRRAAENLPSAYDSRDYGFDAEVKDQGSTGSCWAFGSLGVLSYGTVAKGWETADSADFSAAHLAWAAYTADPDESKINYGEYNYTYEGYTAYTNGGDTFLAYITLRRGCGIADESDYPFDGENPGNMGNYSVPDDLYVNNGYTADEFLINNDPSAVKEWIMQNGAAIISYYASASKYKTTEGNGVNYYSGKTGDEYCADHEIMVVGWDDGYSKNNFSLTPENDGAWLCRNSWGTDWGDDGYFWLSYDEPSIETETLTVAKTEDMPMFTHSYNAAYPVGAAGSDGSLTSANVFTMSNDEVFRSVTYSALNGGVNVTASLYELNDNFTSPQDGRCLWTGTRTDENSGFFTIDGDTSIILKKGVSYSVVIAEEGDGQICVPVETVSPDADDGMLGVYTSYDRQSWIFDEGEWTDSHETTGNFFITLGTDCAHTDASRTGAYDATCTSEGFTGDGVCNVCGADVKGEVIPMLPHTDVNGDGICDVCSETFDVVKNRDYIVSNVVIDAESGNAPYGDLVTYTATAENLPEGYVLAIYEKGELVEMGDNEFVCCIFDGIERTHNLTVAAAYPDGTLLTGSDGSTAQAEGTISVKSGLLYRIIAIFRRIFVKFRITSIGPYVPGKSLLF